MPAAEDNGNINPAEDQSRADHPFEGWTTTTGGSHQGHSFDNLAKGLASGSVSRRRALKMMGGALVGGLLASIPGVSLAHHRPDHTGGGTGCPSGITCKGQCCPVGASCAGRGRNQACACPQGQTDCGGVCRDLATDVLNCGACGSACGTGASCVGGQCSVVCAEDQNLCPSTNTCVKGCNTFPPELGLPMTDAIFNPTTCQCECQTGSTNVSRYEPDPVCCPDAQACGNTCCPEGWGCLDPNAGDGRCEPLCTGATNCCCSCTYRDNTTGNIVSGTCDSASTLSYEQCQQQCETNAPPNTTTETWHFCAPVDYRDQQGNPIPTNVICSGDYKAGPITNTPSSGGQCVVIQCVEA